MNTRLVINLREGIIEAEGEEGFVRSVYEDFKGRVDIPPVSTGSALLNWRMPTRI